MTAKVVPSCPDARAREAAQSIIGTSADLYLLRDETTDPAVRDRLDACARAMRRNRRGMHGGMRRDH